MRVWRLIKWKYVCAVCTLVMTRRKIWRFVWKEWRLEGEQERGKENENERKREEDWKEKERERKGRKMKGWK